MLILSLKLTKTKIFCAIAVVAVVLAGITLTISSENVTSVIAKNEQKVATNEQRVSYINSYGYEVSNEPTTIKEIIIPEQFDEVFLKYAEIMAKGGFVLENYKGKRVKCYTYSLKNVQEIKEFEAVNENEQFNVNLYCYNDKVVSGDISSTKLGGAIKPLEQK
ncbi:MAG: DUF4830 domain-containing protein [Clostridia bacterium]